MRPYTWRQAIQKSDLAPTTKHVLLNLSCYINDAGQAAFPSIDQQAQDTGLSRRAVITHLKSVEGRWLSVSRHGYGGQKWARNEYLPRLPDGELAVAGVPESQKGGERASPPFAEKLSEGSERRSPPLRPEGGEPDDTKVVNVVHSNRPEELTTTPQRPLTSDDLLAITGEPLRRWFESEFWTKYPKRTHKAEAFERLEKLRPDHVLLAVIAKGLEHRLTAEKHAKAKGDFFPDWPEPHRWLRRRRWEDRYEVPRETSSGTRCRCGAPGVMSDGRSWFCAAHEPGAQRRAA